MPRPAVWRQTTLPGAPSIEAGNEASDRSALLRRIVVAVDADDHAVPELKQPV